MAEQLIMGEKVNVAVYLDGVVIAVRTNHWNISLNDMTKMDSTQQPILLRSEGRSLVVPRRSIDPAIRADVLAILAVGTQRYG